METYVHRFERELVEEYPYELPEEEKCRLLWQGVPQHVRNVSYFHADDYYLLRSEVLYAELIIDEHSGKRPRVEESLPRSIRQRGETSGVVKQEEEKDPEEREDPMEDDFDE